MPRKIKYLTGIKNQHTQELMQALQKIDRYTDCSFEKFYFIIKEDEAGQALTESGREFLGSFKRTIDSDLQSERMMPEVRGVLEKITLLLSGILSK